MLAVVSPGPAGIRGSGMAVRARVTTRGRAAEERGFPMKSESPTGTAVIELEVERCSLDSLGAFTDKHYCGPAVTRGMHSDDTHSQMWVGSDSRAKLAALFIHIIIGIQTAHPNMTLLTAHICRGAIDH